MHLAAALTGRDNNLNLIRMVAATGVLISHAYPIAIGPDAAQPFENILGFTLGHLCVLIFFAVSGLLITQSFDRTTLLSRWCLARAVRLLPGLCVVTLLTAFVLGPLVTELPMSAYFKDPQTYSYAPMNITMFKLQYDLPGVFGALPYPSDINGSLWTLSYEVLCYGAVAILGWAGVLTSGRVGVATMAGLGVFFAGCIFWDASGSLPVGLGHLAGLGLPFALGGMAYCLRDRIVLSIWGILALAAIAWVLRATPLWEVAFTLALTYAVFWVAYIPGGALRHYNRLGDYSYGMYIYAFPVQQTVIFAFGAAISPLMNIAVALPVTMVLAVLSWHGIERPALRLKGRRTSHRPRRKNAYS